MASALPTDLDSRLDAIAALQDPVRRALYLYVVTAGRAVSRDEAAGAAGIRRGLAAFHLDRLATDGLVEVEFRRLTGRTGPGAGRPAKLYRTAAAEQNVTLPPRSYAFAADLLAEVVEASRPGGSGASAEQIAERRGRAMGETVREQLGARPSARRVGEAVDSVLADFGYQPYRAGSSRLLLNCPFHALVEQHRDLVCRMNEAFLRGLLEGAGARFDAEPMPDETDGACCVVLRSARGNARNTS